ncbi:MAG: GNAT family N-acetyltransferase [Dehalococcoidia bacterium]
MTIHLTPMQAADVDELGRICYEAFRDIAEKHGFPPDFPSTDVARKLIGALVQREDCYCVAARRDGALVGSSFLTLGDDVGGVGPVSVDVSGQGQAVGRHLMRAVLEHAEQQQIRQVRLLQDGFNMISLSLYASVGFDVKAPAVLLQTVPAERRDPAVRAALPADLPRLDELCQRLYRVSRKHEIAGAIESATPPLLREQGGRLTGYLIPRGRGGHGVAESEADALALIAAAAEHPAGRQVFCPLNHGSLYRQLLQTGCRAIKIMNLMAYGPSEPPEGIWLPSILY